MTGTTTSVHDDGSSASMFDLLLTRDGAPVGACEVTGAASEDETELWNIANGDVDPLIIPALHLGWIVVLRSDCRFNDMKPRLESLLGGLEAAGVISAGYGDAPRHFEQALEASGIARVMGFNGNTPGEISFTIDTLPDDSWHAKESSSLSQWISTWVSGPDQQDNIDKLLASGMLEKHLFVIVPVFTPAPSGTVHQLMRPNPALPRQDPSLPDGITHIWLAGGLVAGDILSWSKSTGWRSTPKAPPTD